MGVNEIILLFASGSIVGIIILVLVMIGTKMEKQEESRRKDKDGSRKD